MKRDAYFDNARLILIFLVVFGHLIQPFIDQSTGLRTLYIWIYIFHMPAFIMISGFFARGYGNKAYIVNLVKKLLVPYVIFQLTYSAFYHLIGKSTGQASLFNPQWSLWFLISLFSWHVLLILFKKIRPLIGIPLSILIGLSIGYIDDIGHYFSLSRTFVFFPFFLIGFWLTKEHIANLTAKRTKVIATLILMLAAITIYTIPNFNVGWLLASRSYEMLGVVDYGSIVRITVYAASLLMAFCIISWIPKTEFKLTYLGSRTLYVYILHGFIIQSFREFNSSFEYTSIFDIIGFVGISAAIVLLLSSKWIIGVWQPLIEGRVAVLKNIFNENRI